MDPNNILPPADPWARYLQNQRAATMTDGQPNFAALGTTHGCQSVPVAGSSLGDASGRVPQMFQQQSFHPGFSVPVSSAAGGPFLRTAGPTQQNTGFGAAQFSSALGLGSGTAPVSGTMKSSAFDLLGNQRPQGHMQQGFFPSSSSPNASTNPAQSNQLIAQALNQALTGEKKNIPVWNGSPSTLRSWLKLLALWEHESQMPMEKRGVKLLQSFAEGSEPRRIADTVPMHVLLSPSGYSSVLSAIYEKYFPYLEASAPKAVDKFIYEGERQKSESFTSFIASKQLARQEMESQLGEIISDRLCGRILLRQAGLNEFQREMLMLRGTSTTNL